MIQELQNEKSALELILQVSEYILSLDLRIYLMLTSPRDKLIPRARNERMRR